MSALNLHELELSALANHFYHQRAERIFTYWVDGSAILQIVLLALATVASIDSLSINPNHLTTLLIIVTGCVTGVTLGARLSDRKAQHQRLQREWMAFLKQVRKSQEDDLEGLGDRFHEINQEEPPCNDKRLNWAYEKACRSMGLEPVGGRSGGHA